MRDLRSTRAGAECSDSQSRSIVIPSRLPLFRGFRLDTQRPSSRDRGEFGFGLNESAAAGAELRSIPDHADRDAVDIGNLGTAKPKRIAAARLFLLLRVSLPCRGPHQYREYCAQQQAELDIPGAGKHRESPECCFRRIVSEGRRNGKKDRTSHRKPSWKSERPGRFFTVVACGFDGFATIYHAAKRRAYKSARLAVTASSFHSMPMPGTSGM